MGQNAVLAALSASLLVVGASLKQEILVDAPNDIGGGGPGPAPPWSCRPPAQPGAPRPWEAAIQVSTYSVANAVNRNLFTAIPIVSWSGLGPDVSVTLYHNSANVGSGNHYGLGEGWSISYGARLDSLDGGPTDQTRVVADDGTQDVYTLDMETGTWIAPPGVHDRLTVGDGASQRLIHKDQSYRTFSVSTGQLIAVGDGLGNEITITYIQAGRRTTV